MADEETRETTAINNPELGTDEALVVPDTEEKVMRRYSLLGDEMLVAHAGADYYFRADDKGYLDTDDPVMQYVLENVVGLTGTTRRSKGA